jgi:hypothetical protein
MLFIFSTPELIRNLWQLKTGVFLHWCIIRAVPLGKFYPCLMFPGEAGGYTNGVPYAVKLYESYPQMLD